MTPPRYALPNAFVPLRAAHLAGKRAAGLKAVVGAGELVITTGRLVACDPMMQPERPAFTRAVAPGSYPVHLFVAKEGAVIGFAEVRVRSSAVARFEMATLAGQDAADLGPRESFGYPVGAGLGCFADEVALRRLREADDRLQGAGDYTSYYDAVVRAELLANGGTWADHRPDPGCADNVVIFRSGDGDGNYATYFGFDAEDELACVVTSFRCFKEPETAEQRLAALAEVFAALIAAIDRDIGAGLRDRGFSGPVATYKVARDGGELRLEYTRDGLAFQAVSSALGRRWSLTHFRWARGRSLLDVGNEHSKAGVPLQLTSAVAIGDGALVHAARLGASYAAHWEALERAVLGYLPIKRR